MLELGVTVFFKSVSHQLYGDLNRHLEIRAAGVQYLIDNPQYLIDNPEYFIESNTQGSWLGYLTNMSLQGTWADHIVIQAIANAMGLNIHIVESDNRFLATNVVESISGRNPRTVFLGHISETHYVSTCPVLLQNASETSLNTKTTRSEYMKNYRGKRTSGNDKAKRNEYNKKSRANKDLAEDRAKRNAYNKKSRANKNLAEDRAKRHEYVKKSRARKTFADDKAKHNDYMKQYKARKKVATMTLKVQFHYFMK